MRKCPSAGCVPPRPASIHGAQEVTGPIKTGAANMCPSPFVAVSHDSGLSAGHPMRRWVLRAWRFGLIGNRRAARMLSRLA